MYGTFDILSSAFDAMQGDVARSSQSTTNPCRVLSFMEVKPDTSKAKTHPA